MEADETVTIESLDSGWSPAFKLSKRAFDLVFALAAIVVVSPVLLGVACCIVAGDRGAVFYRGARVGVRGRSFRMLKFRTMAIGADRAGPSSTKTDDPRITPVGRWLRRLKLDELPQLYNVLIGEMSFVGPRPQVQWAVDLYSPSERIILAVRPGITDYASLKFRNEGELLRGAADPDRAYLQLIAPDKTRLAIHYIQTASMVTDLSIIAATALAVLGFSPDWCQPADADTNTSARRS